VVEDIFGLIHDSLHSAIEKGVYNLVIVDEAFVCLFEVVKRKKLLTTRSLRSLESTEYTEKESLFFSQIFSYPPCRRS